jgi:membrane-associated protease RseP (regulator of RpoE activity)
MSLSDGDAPLPRAQPPYEVLPPIEPAFEPLPPTPLKFRNRLWLHAVLFLATLATTTLVGSLHYAGFLSDFVNRSIDLSSGELLVRGLWYSGTVLIILGTHELGHYVACRYYGIDASLPYFVPLPPPITLFGTLGAVIRIRERIPTKVALFDIGVAGPIAGFLATVPALVIGLSLSRVVQVPSNFEGLSLGEPLLFRATSWLIWGTTPEGYSVNMHPMAFGAWFGLLATALNLIPIGQLDGGHISYAVLGRRSTAVSIAALASALVLTALSTSWVVWTALMVGMMFAFGIRHPYTVDEDVPLDPRRKWLAFFALVMLVLCFTPVPLEFISPD